MKNDCVQSDYPNPISMLSLCRFLKLFLLLLCFSAGTAIAADAAGKAVKSVDESKAVTQSGITVTGVVTDQNGEPVIGANVVVKGNTQTGTITDFDGNFTLNVPANSTLVVSFVGYASKEVTVKAGQKKLTIVLSDDSEQLEEVVVVGYGVQKKESVVGSIAQVGNKDLRRAGNSSDLTESLAGQMPGLVSLSSSGEPGGVLTGESSTSMYIRGKTSWNGGSPLILVDGVERNMNNIDVNEVERISILKDASATAVFGVKGANGVILITTKRGSEGKTKLNFNYTVTGKMLSKQPDKMDSYDAMMIKNEAIEREGVLNEPSWSAYMPQDIINQFRNQTAETALIYPNIDWEKAMFRDFAVKTHHVTASAQGGSNKIHYFGSLSYLHEGDQFKKYDNYKDYDPNYNFDRLNFRSNIDFNLTNTTRFKVDLSGFFSRKNTNYNNEGSTGRADQWMWSATYFLAPNLMIPMYPDGYWGCYVDGSNNSANPPAVVYNIGLRQTRATQLNANFKLEQDLDFITKGLKFEASLYYDNSIRSEGGIYDSTNHVRASESSTTVAYKYIDWKAYRTAEFANGSANVADYTQYFPKSTDQYGWIAPTWSTREEEVGDGKNWTSGIPVMRRMVYQGQLSWNRSFGVHNASAMGVFKREEYAMGSMFKKYREDWIFRATYDYDGRYMFEANGAYNGTEQFGPNYRFEFFPSLALGWYLSNEKFWKVDWVNRLKFRGSWGKVGDDNISGSRWLYSSQYAKGTTAYLNTTYNGRSPYSMYYESVIGNPDIHWETATKVNVGLEAGFLKDMFTLSFDYFTEDRYDILLAGGSRSIPAFFGATAPSANLGKVKSHGFEFEVGFNKQITKDLGVWVKANYNHNQNEILEKDDPKLQYDYLKAKGFQIGQTKNKVSAEMYTNWDMVYASVPTENNDNQKLPGYWNMLDFNGDGMIKDSDDTPPIGYSEIPQNTGAVTLGVDYKGWSFMAQFTGANNATRVIGFNNFQSDYDIVFGYNRDYWSTSNPDGTSFVPRWKTSAENVGDFWVYDASYVRLQNIELSYSFDTKSDFFKKLGCDNLRIFLNGNNLFFWSDLPDDRSTTYSGGSATNGAYPTLKRINLGVDLSF